MTDDKTEKVWISVMGRRMRMWMNAADAARRRKGNRVSGARKAALMRRARAAVDAYINSTGDLTAALDAIAARTRWEDSNNRLWRRLIIGARPPPRPFLPAVAAPWPPPDRTSSAP